MAKTTNLEYTNKELLILMLKDKRIHEGNWALSAKLKFSSMNIGELADGSDASPAGVVAVVGCRLECVQEPLPFSINAAQINPKK